MFEVKEGKAVYGKKEKALKKA
ncbi:hypothetical protein PITCH_A190007 [uncultured Desulfobacterium sp.]|uniref:Uncharacterized protein n=1 Tax=uncultured Desulfobacterium sp. TaxID=201089 RepID=A0A445MVP7_9BACT|nr:hypothetical protein PITCH_A190007 [uncultured Desulfobacterium sp.]